MDEGNLFQTESQHGMGVPVKDFALYRTFKRPLHQLVFVRQATKMRKLKTLATNINYRLIGNYPPPPLRSFSRKSSILGNTGVPNRADIGDELNTSSSRFSLSSTISPFVHLRFLRYLSNVNIVVLSFCCLGIS